MAKQPRNIKSEIQRIGAASLALVVLICATLIYSIQKASTAVSSIDQYDALSKSVNDYQTQLERTIFNYKILATGINSESMILLDQLKTYEKKAEQIRKDIEKHSDRTTNLGLLSSNFSGKTAEVFGILKAHGQKMVLDFIDNRASDSQISTKAFQEDAKKIESLISVIEERVPKLIETERSKDLRLLSFIEKWAIIGCSIIAMLIAYLIAYLYRFTNVSLTHIVSSLRTEILSLSDTTSDVSKISYAISQGANQQSEIVQETNLAMSEISGILSQTSEYAKQSETVMSSVTQKASNGMHVMQQVVDAMSSVEKANQQLQTMNSIIQEIGYKTAIINDIVFKTQLLSFNASIEAARAGQHGRGFAVVAEEVGNLAKMSGKAAKEISELLKNSESQVEDIVDYTQKCVVEGRSVTALALKEFKEISSEITTVAEHLDKISMAAREQEIGVAQTNHAMSKLNETTEQNNEAAKAASSTSEVLSTKIKTFYMISNSIEKSLTGTSNTKPIVQAPQKESKIFNLNRRKRGDGTYKKHG